MRDKLIKIKKQKLDPIHVLEVTETVDQFISWLNSNFECACKKHIFSIKRLARIFLSEHPDLYDQYKVKVCSDEETIRIAQDKSFWEND